MIRAASIALAAFALSLLSGCATGGVTLPPLPAWQQPANPEPITGFMVRLDAAARFPGVPVHVSDSSYIRVNRAWLDDYLAWTWEAAKRAGVRYTPESFDCEDFALGFHFFAARAAAKAGAKSAPLIARIVVDWGPNARHELIGIATDGGIVIVEPQPDAGPFRVWPLEGYNKRVLSIVFGDFNPP